MSKKYPRAHEILTQGSSGYGCTLYTTAHDCPRKARLSLQKLGTQMPVPNPDKQNALVLGSIFHALCEHWGDE